MARHARTAIIIASLIFLLAHLLPSKASQLWMDFSLASYHIHADRHYNQLNYGAGLEYQTGDEVIYMAGAYRNSYDRTSAYALTGWTPLGYRFVHAGVVIGALSGYPGTNNGHFGATLAGIVRVEYSRLGFNILLIPPSISDSPWTMGLQTKIRF